MELNMYNGGYDYEEQVTFIPLIEECEGEYPENKVGVNAAFWGVWTFF